MQVFADTMIYLHFKSLDLIDLTGLLGNGAHEVLVARTTLRELDEHKNTGKSTRLRERARKALKKIESWTQPGHCLPNGLTVSYCSDLPQLDYPSRGLNPLWGDDVLLATALEYREKHPLSEVVILTDDTGIRLKAEQLGLRALKPSEEWRLPNDLDPLEIEKRELLRRIADIQKPLPRLVVSLVGGGVGEAFKEFSLPLAPAPADQVVERKMDELKAEFQPLSWSSSPTPVGMPASAAAAVARFSEVPQSEYERYNKGLGLFFESYQEYLGALWALREMQSRMIVFSIQITNTGSGPAEDVDVHIHFPDGFALAESDEAIDVPEEPRPPAKPRTAMESLVAGVGPSMVRPMIASLGTPAISRSFSIKRTHSYDVNDHFQRIKQGSTVRLPQMAAIFPSRAEARSFSCDFRLQPVNLPSPEVGTLHFVISTQEAGRSEK